MPSARARVVSRLCAAQPPAPRLMLLFRPDLVRAGYQDLPQSPSSKFITAMSAGDRTMNPGGMGGFPLKRAAADVARKLLAQRTRLMGDTIMRILNSTGGPMKIRPAPSRMSAASATSSYRVLQWCSLLLLTVIAATPA